jgi:Na+-transporting methylmalonyl-CoA/oxaloacetate decarboxylase gamma subunit
MEALILLFYIGLPILFVLAVVDSIVGGAVRRELKRERKREQARIAAAKAGKLPSVEFPWLIVTIATALTVAIFVL